MTFESDDLDRSLHDSARLEVEGFRDVDEAHARGLIRYARKRTHHYVNLGIRDKATIEQNVLINAQQKYGSVILMAILCAVISFVVQKILHRIWPDKPDVKTY